MTKQTNLISEKRIKLGAYIVRIDRIRRGKVQRKKLVSARKNYKVVKNKLKRLKTSEIRKRKIATRRAVIKRRAKKMTALRKRRLSILKGKRLNLYK